jgi:phage tail sheath protein FI
VRHFFMNGGRDARIASARRPRGASAPDVDSYRAALARLDRTDFGLLCLPDLARVRPDDVTSHPGLRQIYADAAALCQRAGALLLVDLPADVTTSAQAEAWCTDLLPGTSHAAAFFPQLQMRDPLTRAMRPFAPSGVAAGIIARMDRAHGPWKAPAGTAAIARGARGLARRLSSAEQGRLNIAGINCFRCVQTRIVLFGARTLARDATEAPEYKYVPVRRTAWFIEKSIARALGWVVFEPNDEPLWAEIRKRVNAFMQQLFGAGAFQGSKPEDAYFVKCDAGTMTRDDIANGTLNVVVGFAPLRPAEFVVLRLQQMARPCRDCS